MRPATEPARFQKLLLARRWPSEPVLSRSRMGSGKRANKNSKIFIRDDLSFSIENQKAKRLGVIVSRKSHRAQTDPHNQIREDSTTLRDELTEGQKSPKNVRIASKILSVAFPSP